MGKKWISGNYNLQAVKKLKLIYYDTCIIDWIYVFMHSPKMVHEEFVNNKTGRIETYYWVSYTKLLADLEGIIPITSKRSLVRRLDYYCQINLMNRIIKKSFKGTYTFYNFNDKELAILLDEEDFGSDEELYSQEDSETLMNEILEKASGNKDNSVIKIEPHDTTVQWPLDKDVQCALDTGVHPKYSLANNSLATTTTDAELIFEIKNSLLQHFGSSSIFSEDFIKDIVLFFGNKDINLLSEYLNWCYCFAKEKATTNKTGFFYRIVCKENIWSTFISEQTEKLRKKEIKLINCPACGKQLQYYTDCDNCGLPYNDFKDKEKIDFHKKLIALSENEKKLYDDKLCKIYTTFTIQQAKLRENAIQKLNEEFHLI